MAAGSDGKFAVIFVAHYTTPMEASVHPGSIVILDFGGQYAHLIANRVRRLGAYSEIRVAGTSARELKGAAGIILSGGPQSVYDKKSPQADHGIFELGIPILGLCYGHQWLAHALSGKVSPGKTKEYGSTPLTIHSSSALFRGLPESLTVWMSHGDEVTVLPKGFTVTAKSPVCAVAAMANESRQIYGLQFHIEVTHTEHGMEMLKKFVELCRPAPWKIDSFVEHIGREMKKEVGKKKVFMLVSGGVDSTVAFTLLNTVLGPKRVQGLLVDTGLMRKDEIQHIQSSFKKLKIKNLHIEDASEEFFKNLKGVTDPEEKRKIIGRTFLDVQARVSKKMGLSDSGPSAPPRFASLTRSRSGQSPRGGDWLLGQGTIYPDTIETGGTRHADQIKTHHNRVDAVQKMITAGQIIEPLKELYKDEVRMLGEELGLPRELVWRHPFPGPGLGVRILCAASAGSPSAGSGSGSDVGKQISVPYHVLPVRSVGVQGDGRTYRHAIALFSRHPCRVTPEHKALATVIPNTNKEINRVLLCTSHDRPVEFHFTPGAITRERADLLREADTIAQEEMRAADLYGVIWQFPVVLLPFGSKKGEQSIVLRPIVSVDAMTANAYLLEESVLETITQRLLGLKGIDTVFLDLTNKPPGTIEWE